MAGDEEKYQYFSDSSLGTRLGNYRLSQKLAKLGPHANKVDPPPQAAWTLHDSPLAAPDKYYFMGGYVKSTAREKGKKRPGVLTGHTTFTSTNWDIMDKKRNAYIALREKNAGVRMPPSTSYSDSYLNWGDQKDMRKGQERGEDPPKRIIPQRPPEHTGANTRQPISMAQGGGAKVVSTSNGPGGMRDCIAHIFPQGHVTYDQLLKHPWAYNDQMRVTGTTHTKFPMELNC
jgi:hypothetical protein